MAKKPIKKQPFEKAKEIELQGNLKTLYPIIEEVANELRLKNFAFEARPANSRTTDSFAWFDVFIIDTTTTTSKIPIGAVTLLSPGSKRTRLRVPPRSRWHHDGGLTADEKVSMGLSASQYDEHFVYFIRTLENRLTELGLKVTRYKRLWHELKDFISTIIAKFLAEKSK